MAEPLQECYRFYNLMNANLDHMATDPEAKSADLGCESAFRLVPSTLTLAIDYYYLARKVTLILPSRRECKAESTNCGRDVQPAPKAVRSSWLLR